MHKQPENGWRLCQLVCFAQYFPLRPHVTLGETNKCKQSSPPTLSFCLRKCSSQCLPCLYLEAKTMISRA